MREMRAGDAEHLAHPGTALGPLVADDHDIAGLDLLFADRGHGILLVVEDAGRALEMLDGGAGELEHAPLLGEVAVENDEPAGGLEGFGGRPDDLLAARLGCGPTYLASRAC